jgi:hypothetical protein
LPRLGVCGREPSAEIAAPAKQMPNHWKFYKAHTVRDLHMAFGLPYMYNYITKLCRQQAEAIQNHENANVRNIGQGEPRQSFKLGGGRAYDRSTD